MLAGASDLSFSGAMNCIKSSAYKTTKACSEGNWTTQSDKWIASGSAEHSPCFGFGVVDANAMLVGAKNGTCGACISTAKVDGCFGDYNGRDDDCSGTVDDDCSSGGKGRAGSACSDADDCINTAVNPICLTGEGWTGGYCSANCTSNSNCYNGSGKVECYEGHCIAKCSYNEVRSGYSCIAQKILPAGSVATANCGNDVKEEGEVCDGDTKTCHSIDSSFTDGYAMCRADCRGYDTSTCSGGGGSLCGNKNIDAGEVCDSETIPCKQLAGAPEGGTAKCASDCLSWDRSSCYDPGNGGGSGGNEGGNGGDGDHANCGNGYVDPGEQCDDGNRMDGDGCSQYCMFEDGKATKKKSSGCSALIL
jgi:cysteine-rich repeat protein